MISETSNSEKDVDILGLPYFLAKANTFGVLLNMWNEPINMNLKKRFFFL